MASKEFRFHYVKTPTGAISGQSVLTQTEDAINNLGDYMAEATVDATEALNKATEALNTANTAQQNAAEALSTANSALGKVNTLTTTVNTFDGRITKAESNAANAVTASAEASNNAAQAITTSNSALTTAQQAVTTANAANTTAQNASASAAQAVGTANAANATAGEAKRIALQAVTDTDAIREEINQNMAVITQKVTEATTQAQNSAASAGESKASSDLSKRWATWTTGVETEDGTIYTVDNDGYSSKWNAQLAQAWAVKTDGKVTENNLPDGAEIDYSAKYYAQQAGSSNSAAKASADAAKASQTAAASSAAAAKASQDAAKASETAAKASKTAAAGSASTASTKATEASASAQKAKDWASKEDGPVEGSGETAKYSAKYYAEQANQSNSVKYIAQTLTAEQQTQARANIGAAASADAILTGTTSAEALSVTGKLEGASGSFTGVLKAANPAADTDLVTLAYLKALQWLTDGAIVGEKLANNAVTAAKIAANAVDSSKIKDGSIAFADLAAAAIATQDQAIAGTAENLLLTPQGAKAMIDNALSGQTDSGVPSGVMVPFAGETVPDGWLLCNGASLAKASYPDLFNAIGYTWGGSGNTFYLPNYNGRHILGTTHANNVGSTVSAGLPNIIGEFDVGHAELIYTSGAFSLIAKEASNYGTSKDQTRKIVKFKASSENSIYGRSNNVNVPSAYALIIIKD